MAPGVFSRSIQGLVSGDLATKVRAASELVLKETVFDAVQVTFLDRKGGQHVEIANVGHDADVSGYFISEKWLHRCVGFQHVKRRKHQLLRWEDTPGFHASDSVRSVLSPTGYGNGTTMLLLEPDGDILGMCNFNTARSAVPLSDMDVLAGMRPVFASLAGEVRRYTGAGLSGRETEILRLVAEGFSNREIGDLLFISPRTVSTHVEHILVKLGVNGRVQAATYAVRAGLLGPD